MKQLMTLLYNRLSKPWVLVLTGVLMLSTYFLQLTLQHSALIYQHMINFQLAFTLPRALRIIATWGPEGIDAVINTMWVDYLIPIGYSLFIAGAFAWVTKKFNPIKESFVKPVFVLPFFAIGFDYLENLLEVSMLSQGWVPNAGLLLLASSVSLCKWVCVLIPMGVMAYAAVMAVKRRVA